jgi:hypothetical protein
MTSPPPGGTLQRWRFYDYVKQPNNRNVIEDWLAGKVRQRMLLMAVLTQLSVLEIQDWEGDGGDQFKWLTETANAGIGEIRFKCDGPAHRPLGCVGLAAKQFCLLVGASKITPPGTRTPVYYPPDCFEQAQARRDECGAGTATLVERQLP